MNFDLQDIFATRPIDRGTINGVYISPSFILFMYILISVILIFAAAVFLIKKASFVSSLKKAFIVAFFSAGVVYAVYADIGWSRWLMSDARTYAGLSTDEKLLKMDDAIYAFALIARKTIPCDYMLFSANDYVRLREEYLLLPLRKRAQSDYIVVLADPESHYDKATLTFSRGSVKISPVELLIMPASYAYILKRKQS